MGGLILALTGVILLYVSWRQRVRPKSLVAAAWLMLAGSLLFWARTGSAEKAVAAGIIVIMFIALALVAVNAWRTAAKPPRTATARRSKIAGAKQGNHWRESLFKILLMVPLASIAVTLLCTAIFMILTLAGVAHSDGLTIVMIAFPLIWAIYAMMVGYERWLWRSLSIIILTAAIPTGLLLLLNWR